MQNYTYDPTGQVIADQASEVSGGAARMNEQLQYAFDPAGNLKYRTNNTLVENFQVNTVNELTANTNGGKLTVMGTATFQNSDSVTVNGTNALVYKDATFAATNMPLTTSYTAVAADSLGRHSTNTVNVNLATDNTAFVDDGNGNLTYDGLRNFAYDDENQLIQVYVSNQWSSQFTYDGKMRRRIRQEFTWQGGAWVQTNEVYYVYDGNVVIQERSANNTPTTTYTRGLDLSASLQGAGGIGGLLAMTLNTSPGPSSSNSYYYHSDGNGNVTMLINSSQAIVAKYLYDAFGNTLSAAGSLAQANLYRFSSKEAHLNSGLVYYLYRYYDPNLQRWPNRDPMGEFGFEHLRRRWWFRADANSYSFLRNNPNHFFDPFGLQLAGDDDPEPGENGAQGWIGVLQEILRLGDNNEWWNPSEQSFEPYAPYNPNAPLNPLPGNPVCIYQGPPPPPPPPSPPIQIPPGSGCSTCDVNNPPQVPFPSPPRNWGSFPIGGPWAPGTGPST